MISPNSTLMSSLTKYKYKRVVYVKLIVDRL